MNGFSMFDLMGASNGLLLCPQKWRFSFNSRFACFAFSRFGINHLPFFSFCFFETTGCNGNESLRSSLF